MKKIPIPQQILEEDYRIIAQHKELLAMEARRNNQPKGARQ
jgi:hypothetical protein